MDRGLHLTQVPPRAPSAPLGALHLLLAAHETAVALGQSMGRQAHAVFLFGPCAPASLGRLGTLNASDRGRRWSLSWVMVMDK